MSANLIQTFSDSLLQSLAAGSFVKLSLGGYRGSDAGLQKITARRILVKNTEKLSFTYRYKTRDIVKNYDFNESAARVSEYLNKDFTTAALLTTEFDLQFDGKKLKRSEPTQTEAASLEHDRKKQRVVANDKAYLHALGITDAKGNVHPTAQDKYRQINKYIEVLSGLVAKLSKTEGLRVADMGAGKGYLTFALYDHLATAGMKPQVTGVEYREDLVKLCNGIAKDTACSGLKFVQGSIEQFDASDTDILIALHACDTATDDAIAKGIAAKSELIVVAPCCHKQVRQQMDAAEQAAHMEFLLKHGTFMERQAEMVTDGLRALLLELHGYKTNLFEFISDAHTPKNIMITAIRGALPNETKRKELLEKIASAKAQFGIRQHYLETILP